MRLSIKLWSGFLDFVSYMAASLATKVFADAATTIGWGKLILIWTALMIVGYLVSLPYEFARKQDET